jgi:phage-related protein
VAGKGATLAIKITGDAADAKRAFDDVEDHGGRMSGVFGKVGAGIAVGAAIGGAALVKLGKDSFDAASDLQQSTGAIDAVFGDWAVDVEQNAQKAATAVGLSASQYENSMAVIGAQLHNAGMAHGEMTDKATDLIQKGADMAAIFGGTATDAVDALSSALKGEMDPIERYGVSLNDAAIKAQMAADGNDKLTGAAEKTAKTNAILELITKQTADTQGAWAAQTGTAAESQQILSAKLDNVKAKLGEGLLPVFAGAATWVSDKLIPAFEKFTEKGGPLSDMFEKVSKFVTEKVVPAAQDLFRWFSEKVQPIFIDVANVIKEVVVPAFEKVWGYIQDYVIPIFKTTLGPVIDGVRDVIHKLSEKLIENKDKFNDIFEKVKPFLDFMRDKVAPVIGTVLKVAFEALGKVIDPIIDSITWILDKAADVIGFVGKVGSFLFGDSGDSGGGGAKRGAPLVGAARGAAPLRTASFSGGAGAGPTGAAGLTLLPGGDTYNITLNGIIDGDDAAEKIARLLDRRATMTGAAFAAAI